MAKVRLNSIWEMLDACAPGHEIEEREHNFWVKYNGRSFPRLPRGPHGPRKDPEIPAQYVKQLVRVLELEMACAEKHFPFLAKKKKSRATERKKAEETSP